MVAPFDDVLQRTFAIVGAPGSAYTAVNVYPASIVIVIVCAVLQSVPSLCHLVNGFVLAAPGAVRVTRALRLNVLLNGVTPSLRPLTSAGATAIATPLLGLDDVTSRVGM